MTQLTLPLAHGYITGQHCLPMIDRKSIARMVARGIVKPGQPFYCLRLGDFPICIWRGKGKKPAWVTQWLENGGTMKDIEAIASAGGAASPSGAAAAA